MHGDQGAILDAHVVSTYIIVTTFSGSLPLSSKVGSHVHA